MSTANYVGQGTLAPELEDRLRTELSSGERLVYVGQPRPDMFRGQTACLTFVGVFFTAVALFILTAALGVSGVFAAFGGGAANPAGFMAGCVPLFVGLFTLPFLAVGIGLATASVWYPKRIRRIIYALTDRRALVFEPELFSKGYTVRSYTREGLGRMYRVDKADGAGDLVFEEVYTTSTNSDGNVSTSRKQRGFMGIDRVKDVEELVRLTLGL